LLEFGLNNWCLLCSVPVVVCTEILMTLWYALLAGQTDTIMTENTMGTLNMRRAVAAKGREWAALARDRGAPDQNQSAPVYKS